jgi:hypothetical protein
LESQGRFQEGLPAYAKVAEEEPDSPAGADARKSVDALRRRSAD